MDRRIFHGKITSQDMAQNLVAHFNRGNFQVQQIGNRPRITVQIATSRSATSGGQTALSVMLQDVEDGISVEIGQQAWLGVAASLGFSALAALSNPLNLLGRLDDIAQDIENLQLAEEVWKVIDQTCASMGAGLELSNRLRRTVCLYCQTANPVGESNCIACGAPLGGAQPKTCKFCGFVITSQDKYCPNCGKTIS
jgi:hypothetical protein